ncbi:MAG: glycosyltransferase family 9 protein [Candidatus Brocadia sp.]|nr:glycosyltransferase family 9 protein [Candidatus Brocadia sp.]
MFHLEQAAKHGIPNLTIQQSPRSFETVKHILIIRPGAIGDIIVTLPTLRAIRDHFPSAKIEVMGYPPLLEIIKRRFYADAVSRFDQSDIAHLFMKDTKIPTPLMKRFSGMDLIISFVSDKDRIFSGNLEATGARCVIHYNPFPSGDERIHIVDHLLKSLDTLGISSYKIPKVFLHDEDMRFSDDFIRDRIVVSKKILVAIHPGSGSRQKCWPVERFAALMDWLNSEMEAQIFIVSGPADGEIVEELKTKVKNNFTLVDHFSLPKLAAVIRRCNLFLGNDSGITHLAAAMGVHTVAIFGPTDPNIWGPRGEQVKILYKKAICSPCLADIRRNCSIQTCLENIKIDDVMHEVRSRFL